MDFFPSEAKSLEPSVSIPDVVVPAQVARGDSQPRGPSTRSLGTEVTHLNLNVTQAMNEVKGLEVALDQLRTTANELDEKYRTLLQTCGAADQHSQDIERAFAKIDSLAQMRLAELGNASDLATRTERMLARVESFYAENDRQLAAITDARNLLSRELAQARAETQARARTHTPEAFPAPVSRPDSRRVRLDAAIAAIHSTTTVAIHRMTAAIHKTTAAIHKTAARTSPTAIAGAAIAVLVVIGVVATWPDGNASEVGVPVIASRVVKTYGQLPELPQGIAPAVTVAAAPQRSVQGQTSTPRAASLAAAQATGFTGQLAIESSPPGASVFIDGKPVGETPLSSVRIRAGSHAIWVELPKYRRWTSSVHVPAGRVTRVNATLRAAERQ